MEKDKCVVCEKEIDIRCEEYAEFGSYSGFYVHVKCLGIKTTK